MATPVGPLFAGGSRVITKSGYDVEYYADAHNSLLQQAGLAPCYYWLPRSVNLARRDNGDYKFSMVHFVGVRTNSTTVGETSTDNEVAGGVVTFSTTAAPPDAILEEAHAALTAQVRAESDPLWRYSSNARPSFSFIPIVSNQCMLSNTLPGADGSVPASTPGKALGAPPTVAAMRGSRAAVAMPRTVPTTYRGSNLDPMFVRFSGQGPGTIDPGAEKPYSALLGSIPAGIVYNSFHNTGTGVLTVTQAMKVRVVSPMMTIDITGDWSRIQDHFSAAAHAGGLFWSADIKVQFDALRESGDITVHTFIDQSLPGADKLQAYMDQRSDLVFQKFMDLAKTTIFDPAPFNEQPAEASGGLLGGVFGGFGGAMKLRKQRTTLHLEYHETKEMAYLQDYQVGGTLDGIGEAIRANPAKEKTYFTTFDVGDWDRKVTRFVKPIVNWPDPTQKWVGEPVAFLSVQVGYPNTAGEMQWDGHAFNPKDGADSNWNTATYQKALTDVTNPPKGWAPDTMFVKRQIHFAEPPSEFEMPFARVQVEKSIVDLDPGDFGTPEKDINLEVRVAEAGTLSVGPILLGTQLTDDTQFVEVTLQASGTRDDGKPRDPVKFTFKFVDQTEPRYWLVYTGQPGFVPKFTYSIRVVVKGTLFTHGQEWTTTPVETGGSGPIMITVPTPDDPGVTKKDIPLWAATPSGVPVVAPDHYQGPPATPLNGSGTGSGTVSGTVSGTSSGTAPSAFPPPSSLPAAASPSGGGDAGPPPTPGHTNGVPTPPQSATSKSAPLYGWTAPLPNGDARAMPPAATAPDMFQAAGQAQ